MTQAKKKAQLVELDDELAALFAEPDGDEEEPTYEVVGEIPHGDKRYRIISCTNAYLETKLGTGDSGAFIQHMEGMIHPEDWEEFESVLRTSRDMKDAQLIALWKRIWEVASGRPTS
jgi:hypothetical protein